MSSTRIRLAGLTLSSHSGPRVESKDDSTGEPDLATELDMRLLK
jgi:hypothetical protein